MAQRVDSAKVTVDGDQVGRIGKGLLCYVGFGHGDTDDDIAKVARKLCSLRVFPDVDGNMNLSVGEVGGEVLAVSQFTLYADIRKGRRPAFTGAADPALASEWFDRFADAVRGHGLGCETGVFGASMSVESVNAGPVTLILDSAEL